MKTSEIIQEARKNPELNPKTSINQIIIDKINSIDEEIVPGVKNLFISLTSLDKIGINPRSPWDDTPNGIYFYPAEYVINVIGTTGPMTKLPGLGYQPYVNFLQLQGNVIDISDPNFNITEYIDKLQNLWMQYSKKNKKYAIKYIEKMMIEAEENLDCVDLPGGKFWSTVEFLCMTDKFINPRQSNYVFIWNTILRKLGIDAIIDTGQSIIYNLEPTQGVALHIKAIKDIDREVNRYSKKHMELQKEKGKEYERKGKEYNIRSLKPSHIEIPMVTGRLPKEAIRYVNNINLRLRLLKTMPDIIQYIVRPTPVEQQTAIISSTPYEYTTRLREISNIVRPETLIPIMSSNLAIAILLAIHNEILRKFMTPELATSIVKHYPAGFFKLESQFLTPELVELAIQKGQNPNKVTMHYKNATKK